MVSGSTCGSLGHSRHRRGADRHSQRCHRSGRTCIQYIASGMSSQLLTVLQKTACKRDVLGRGRKDIHHTTHIVSESWVKAWGKKGLVSLLPTYQIAHSQRRTPFSLACSSSCSPCCPPDRSHSMGWAWPAPSPAGWEEEGESLEPSPPARAGRVPLDGSEYGGPSARKQFYNAFCNLDRWKKSRRKCVGCLLHSCYYISKAYICRQRVCLSHDLWWKLAAG